MLTALTKLSSRSTTGPVQQERIQNLLLSYATSPELEIQQRAVEFASLFNLGQIREGVLERMPPPEVKQTVYGYGMNFTLVAHSVFAYVSAGSEKKPVGSINPGKDATMIDLLGEEPAPATNGAPAVPNSTQDLLASLFGGADAAPATAGSAPTPAAAPAQRDIAKDILGLFDSPSPASAAPLVAAAAASPPPAAAMQSIFNAAAATPPAPSPAPAAPAAPTGYTAYDQNELRVTLTPQTSPTRPGLVRIIANFQATGTNAVSGLNFQAAVTKVGVLHIYCIRSLTVGEYADSAAPNGPHFKFRGAGGSSRNARDACPRSRRGTFIPHTQCLFVVTANSTESRRLSGYGCG